MNAPVYDKTRYPKLRKNETGNALCRGCSNPVPSNRQTWCSKVCYDLFCPARVKFFTNQRDKGICQICQKSIAQLKDEWSSNKPANWKGLSDARTYAEYQNELGRYRKEYPFPHLEYDHIIPFSEGGLTVLENMRTLCSPCHLKRTVEWRREKAKTMKPKSAT